MIHAYENYLRSIRGYSENTIRAYTADLRCFAHWANANLNTPRWSTISRDDIDKFLTHQHALGIAASTTNRQLAAISSLFRYINRQGIEIPNPTKYESRRRIPQTMPATIPVKELKRAYQHAHGNTKIMLGILATTGVRLQELLNISYEDIDFDANTIRINGKGSKERVVASTSEALHTLLCKRRDLHASGKLFVMSQRTARRMIYDVLAPYCHCKQLSPHAIRHTFATELAKAGHSTTTIAKVLGHSHLETSQKYINMAELSTANTGTIIFNY